MAERPEWSRWPYGRVIALEIGGWPPHWREAVGEPGETDLPRLEATPIAAVDAAATIEGVVTGRIRLDDKGHLIITVEDDSGSLQVLVTPTTPGEYWAAWVDRRIQVDVLAGREGHDAAAKIIKRRRPAPPPAQRAGRRVRDGAGGPPRLAAGAGRLARGGRTPRSRRADADVAAGETNPAGRRPHIAPATRPLSRGTSGGTVPQRVLRDCPREWRRLKGTVPQRALRDSPP